MAKQMKLDALIDAYYTIRQERLSKEKELDPLKLKEAELKEQLEKVLKLSPANAGVGKYAMAELVKKEVPFVANPATLLSFAKSARNNDLVKLSIVAKAVQERWDDGVDIKGVEKLIVENLSVKKRSK